MSPMIEDLALLNVIKEIDSRLPAYIKQFYNCLLYTSDAADE